MNIRKIMFAAVAALAVTASAALEKVCVLQIADASTLAKAVAKLGEISGNQMLGAMTAGFFMEPPGSKFFGPMRPESSALLPIYLDPAAVGKEINGNMDIDDDDIGFAVLYPMVISRADFLKRHPGAVETNGIVRVKGGIDDDDDEDDEDCKEFTYVAFSADGKWACASTEYAFASRALADASFADKPFGGDLVRISVEPGGMAALRKLIAAYTEEAKKNNQPIDKRIVDVFAGFDSMSIGLAIGNAGIDFKFCAKTVEGTELAKVGVKTLPADPLAFAGADALFANSDLGLWNGDAAASWNAVVSILKRHGIDIATFIASNFAPDAASLKFDVKALVKYATGPATNQFAKIDAEKLFKDFKECKAFDVPLKAADKPQNVALSIVGFKPKFTASQRFAATFPEAKGRPLFAASVMSLSALIQAIVPAVIAEIPEKDRAEAQPFLAFLPQESNAGVATMQWREKDRIRCVFRISADEIKGISTAVSAAMAVSMTKQND